MSWLTRTYDYLDDSMRIRTTAGRVIAMSAAVVVYAGAFYVLYPYLGRAGGTLVILPVMVGAHLGGIRGGFATAVGGLIVSTIILYLRGYPDLFSASRIIVAVVTIAFGLGSGVIREATRRGRRSEELLDLAFRAAQDGLWDYRLDTGTVYFNPRWFTMLGYEPDSMPHSLETWRDLLHPDDRDEALAQVNKAVAEGREQFTATFRLRESSGGYRWILARGKAVEFDDEGRAVRLVGIHSDVSELKQAESELVYLAYHDQLTGLPNRKAFYEQAEQTVAQSKRASPPAPGAVLLVDLDHFKDVNGSFGHDLGDDLLKAAADRLREHLRGTDLLFRLGGDEFTIILTSLRTQTDAGLVASNLIRAFGDPFALDGHTIYSSLSIGIAAYPEDGTNAAELIRNSDTALNRAKRERATYRFYTSQMQAEAVAKMATISSLREALELGQFRLHYQPIVNGDGIIQGAEALVRWEDPERGLISPAEFIPVAEETGLILQIGRWVLGQAALDAARWRAEGNRSIHVSVNVSPRQLRHHSLIDDIDLVLAASELPAEHLTLELTEGSLVDPSDESTTRLRDLQGRGVAISIDDFGTGYSSMSYLKRLPVNTIKIDRSFVIGLPDNADDVSIVQAIITMAHGLGLQVVAEGVDSAAQVAFLNELGCDLYQGYFFSRPVAGDELGRLLRCPQLMETP